MMEQELGHRYEEFRARLAAAVARYDRKTAGSSPERERTSALVEEKFIRNGGKMTRGHGRKARSRSRSTKLDIIEE
eukprot:CAMPEP_0170174028 /NCGR_PEP_ID=MMETSP0040_2-20121228/7290_1 /TAXON_ID=641309 /ORGANISM="Lotharella oceanica, Strain CCMP622" /LENGTH=75 /DNA_ID=CAMNT_0010415503 /DNA_START=272 /DNA_END=499 /DNA_ORIENTATION=+